MDTSVHGVRVCVLVLQRGLENGCKSVWNCQGNWLLWNSRTHFEWAVRGDGRLSINGHFWGSSPVHQRGQKVLESGGGAAETESESVLSNWGPRRPPVSASFSLRTLLLTRICGSSTNSSTLLCVCSRKTFCAAAPWTTRSRYLQLQHLRGRGHGADQFWIQVW